MRKSKLFVFSLLLLMIISNAVVTSSEVTNVTLRVRSKVEVDDKYLTLGDIAVVQTKNENLKKALMAVKLCKSPSPGRTFTWDIPRLKLALRQAVAAKEKIKENSHDTKKTVRDISLSSISIEGAKIVQITTSSKEVLPDEIVRRAKEFIEQNQQKDIVVEVLTKPRTVNVPPGEIELKVLKPNKIKKVGYLPLSVQILVNKKPYTTVPILLKLSAPKSKLSENSVITNKAKSTSQGIKPQTTLVKPGDLVILMLKIKSIEITTLARVLTQGAKGDLIRVMNVDSKKIVGAEVIDKKKVRVLINLGAF